MVWPLLQVRVPALHVRFWEHAVDAVTILVDVPRRFEPARFATEAPAPPARLHQSNSEFALQPPDKPSVRARAAQPTEFPNHDHAVPQPEMGFPPARAFARAPPVPCAGATLDDPFPQRCVSR